MKQYKVNGLGGIDIILEIVGEAGEAYLVLVMTKQGKAIRESCEYVSKFFIEEGLDSGHLVELDSCGERAEAFMRIC
jgi:hypothetical protein